LNDNLILKKGTQNSEINIFASAPHTHLAGKSVYTTLIRNGAEIQYISNNPYYDFNYQNLNFLQNPITVKPGDEFHTKCIYNTVGRTDYTIVS
jgi:hypothetical protein